VRNFGRVVKALALGASLARGTGSNPVGCSYPFNLVDLRHLNPPCCTPSGSGSSGSFLLDPHERRDLPGQKGGVDCACNRVRANLIDMWGETVRSKGSFSRGWELHCISAGSSESVRCKSLFLKI
jgi:hypothetical protein